MLDCSESSSVSKWLDFQEDNDSKHTSKIAKDFMWEEGIVRMDWPACSQDLNPIENLWAWIKMQLNFRSSRTLGELENGLN